MKIVLAHDSFTQLGGAEKVVDALHTMFAAAPVYALVLDKKLKPEYQDWDIRTTWLQKIYSFYPHFQRLLPFIPWAAGSVNISGVDVLLSSSSAFAKAFRVKKPGIHINYCHTPTRFLWTDSGYVNQEIPLLLRPLARVFLNWMKGWDYKAAQKVDFFIANSLEVQKRIKRFYSRDSKIIYPPVDINFWHPTAAKSNYFLLAGRLQAHKKNELIIQVFNELGLPLHVVGTGRQENYLRSIAKDNIKFFGRISDEQLRDQYSGALGFIYPQLEDFGLMPIEAAACGTATIGLAAGGSLETIVPGVTGELFGMDNVGVVQAPGLLSVEQGKALHYSEIKHLIQTWNPQKYSVENLRAHAAKFSEEKFKQQILEFINSKMQK